MQERRTPQSTLAWLMAMILLPYVAVPLFLMLGTRKLGRRRVVPGPLRAPLLPGVEGTFAALGGGLPRDGNGVRLLDTPEDAFTELMALVASARHTLDAEFYIVADDPEGRAFVTALAERAKAGVRVRLQIDRIGTLHSPAAELRTMKEAGGELRWFTPLFHRLSRGRLNLRNHRKAVIVDGRRVFTGGVNVAADYLRLAPAEALPFTDLALIVEGPVAQDYANVFAATWGGEADAAAAPEPAGDARVQLIAAGPDRPLDALAQGLAHAIHRADRRVWIATPYFLPTDGLATALATAARRGLDVRIMIPARSNHRIADLARGSYLRGLQAEGCKVLLHPRMLHAKAGVIDGMAWAGSANFDVRSLLLNYETALMLHDEGSAGLVADWFGREAAKCDSDLPPAGVLRRFSEGLFRLGAPLL